MIPMFLPNVSPYELDPEARTRYLCGQLEALLAHHCANCADYGRLIDDWRRRCPAPLVSPEQYPMIPVTIFKEYNLRSTFSAVMTLESSATTSASASKIAVDRTTKKRQAASAHRILSDFIGSEQRPLLVFDVEQTVRGTESLSARGAAILSLAHLASEFHFVLREQNGALHVDHDALDQALAAIGQRAFVAYGFTYILFQVHQALAGRSERLPPVHPESVVLHSGGWKRLAEQAVDKATFNQVVAGAWALSPTRVIDFYGTIEQVGIPYPDCSAGLKHVPYWADAIVRRSDTLQPADLGETGLLQLISCLPLSAPNHSVLTEDLGELVHWDGCSCGRRGKAFVFKGRAPRAEIRGCSDVARR
jgi:hypothetical protein